MQLIQIRYSRTFRLGWAALLALVLVAAAYAAWVGPGAWLLLLSAVLVDYRALKSQGDGVALLCRGDAWFIRTRRRGVESIRDLRPVLVRTWLLIVRLKTARGWRYLWVPGAAMEHSEHRDLRRLAIRGLLPPADP